MGITIGPDIKDATHQRRNHGSGPTVALTLQTVVTLIKKKDFLSNKSNKQRFLCILSSYLKKAECLTIHARGDADVLIVETAIQYSKSRDTVRVGDDTDLLVLHSYIILTLMARNCTSDLSQNKMQRKCDWNIKTSQKNLGSCTYLL